MMSILMSMLHRRGTLPLIAPPDHHLRAGALATATGNTGTTEQDAGFQTDLTALGTGKKQMLGVSLDRMADSVSGQTTVDPTGYLTSLANKKVRDEFSKRCSICSMPRDILCSAFQHADAAISCSGRLSPCRN